LVTCRSVGGSGTVWAHANGTINLANVAAAATATTTVDTTAAANLLVTAQWSAATAGNIINAEGGSLELLG
jgi:hypothetical protein